MARSHARDALPSATTDLAAAKADLDTHGYCILADALSASQVEALRTRITEQAEAEWAMGLSHQDHAQPDDINQVVYMLINKGRIFRDLILNERTLELVGHMLGPGFLLSGSDAVIARPGGSVMPLHTDQWWLPAPTPRGERPGRIGAVRRDTFNAWNRYRPGPALNPPAVCNIMWMACDFTAANGATRIVPGSHLSGENADPSVPYTVETVAATGPAGTAVIFEGRTWHATGVNATNAPRYGVGTNYCGPQFRQMENFTLGTRPEVLAEAGQRLLELLGFRQWDGYGKIGDPAAEYVSREQELIGELRL